MSFQLDGYLRIIIYMKWYSFIFLIVVFLTHADQIEAQEFSVGVYPPVIQASTLPPTVIKPKITLSNKTQSELALNIELKPFRPTGKGDGSVSYPNSKSLPEYLIFPRIKFFESENEINQVILGPNETKEITMQLDVDRDAPLSDYYYSVVFITQSDKDGTENIQIPAGISTNVILSIGQNKSKDIKIDLFSSPKVIHSSPVPFTLLVKNNGENLITPSGNVEIVNMFGDTVEKIPILPEYVLSKSTRFLVEETYASRSSELNTYVEKLDNKNVLLFNKNGLFGKYEAKVNGFILEESGVLFTSSLVFYVLPIPYIIAVFLSITITIVIFIKLKRKKRNNQ